MIPPGNCKKVYCAVGWNTMDQGSIGAMTYHDLEIGLPIVLVGRAMAAKQFMETRPWTRTPTTLGTISTYQDKWAWKLYFHLEILSRVPREMGVKASRPKR